MKYLLVFASLLYAALATADTIEDLRSQIAGADGVSLAVIQADADGNTITAPQIPVRDGNGNTAPMKGTEDYKIALITYIYTEGNVTRDNTVAVALDGANNATWKDRVPSVLAVTPTGPTPIGTEEEIAVAIVAAGNPAVEKLSIVYGDGYADATGYSDVEGKLISVGYLLKRDKDVWAVKPYEATGQTGIKEVVK